MTDIDTGTAVWTRVATFHADRQDMGIDAEIVWRAIGDTFGQIHRLRTTTIGDLELWRREADDE